MGNEQSKPGAEADTQSAGSESEKFDLNDIEDNRQYLAKSSSAAHSTPATDTNMAGGKRKSKRKKKKQGSTLALTGTEDGADDTAPPTASESPVDEEKLLQTLSKREPEQFGFYDSASDKSDNEEDRSEVFYSTKGPAGSLTSTKPEDPEDPEDQPDREAPETGSPVQIESDADSEKPDESQHATEDVSDQDDELVEEPAYLPELNKNVSDHNTINDGTNESNIRGRKRVPCPYAEDYACSKTFSSGYHARRHGNGHKISFTCPVCQKVLKRQDTFDKHVKSHATAEASALNTAGQETTGHVEDVNETNEANDAEESVEADDMDLDPHEPELGHSQRFPCPRAESLGCDKTYTNPHNARYHARSHNRDMSCPLGCVDEKTQAVMTFATEQTRQRHMKRRHPKEARKAVRMAEQDASGGEPTLNDDDTQLGDVDETMQDPNESEEVMPTAGLVHNAKTEPQPDEDGPVIDEFDGTNVSDAHNLDEDDAGSHISAEAAIEMSPAEELNEPEAEEQLATGKSKEKPDERSSQKDSKKRKRRERSSSPTTGSRKSAKKSKQHLERSQGVSSWDDTEAPATDSKFRGVFIGTPEKAKASTASEFEPTERRQSTINNFAQPYTAGSRLRHPLFHPESPEKRKRGQSTPSDVGLDRDDNSTAARKKRRTTGSAGPPTRKGKEKAASGDETEGNQGIADTGLATPNARSPWPASKPRPRMLSQKDKFDLKVSDKDSENDPNTDDEKKARQDAATPKGLVCRVCKRMYKNQKRLNRHMKDPKSHRNLLECEECDEKFYHSGTFTEHKKARGHGQDVEDEGARGRFTEREEASIKRWVKSFCQEHDLTRAEFNQVMQASFRRGIEWRYTFMSKQDFTDEYFDVLPNRDKRSMRRYRNCNFNTTDTSNIWSKEEDDTIIELHEALGPRWNRIGREIDRPGELVRQRWKFKLQTANMESGFWTKPEETAFIDAIQEIRAVSDVSSSTFNWTAVSKIMKTRTPQQCANHWRAKYAGTKKGDVWKAVGNFQPATTPIAGRSKMEQRLAGKLKSSPRTSLKSSMYVKESDEEEDMKAAKDDDTEEENSKYRQSAAHLPKSRRKSTNSEDEEEEDFTRPPESDSEQEAADDEADNSRAPEPGAESDEDDDQEKEAELPRNPLTGITPGKTLTASQAFNLTQANTSAKRFSARKDSPNPSQERPSPPISVRRSRVQSPELGTPDSERNEIEMNADDSDGDASSEESGSNEEDVPQHDGQLDKGSASKVDGSGREGPDIKVSLVDSEDEETSASESEDNNASTALESGSELKSPARNGPSKRVSASASASRARKTSTSGSDSESGSSSASESESEVESESTSPPAHQKSIPSNKKLAQISNDFMSSIHEASLKRKQQVRKPPSKWMDQSSESESEDDRRVASQTLPAMRRRR